MQIQIDGNKIYAPLKKAWIKNNAEEKLRQEFICRLVNVYGYSIDQLAQDVEIRKRYKADIAIWKSSADKDKNAVPSIIITVECKADHISIKQSDYSVGYGLASLVNANFFIAHNLKETKVFHVKKDTSIQKLEKLRDIPKAEIIKDEKQIDKYIKDTKAFTRDIFSKLLTRCHNIIRNNDKLSPEASFDEISKILFMKIMHERDSKHEMIFSLERFRTEEKNYEEAIRSTLKDQIHLAQDYMQVLFNNTKKEFEEDGIFDLRDQIRIKRNSFEMIVEELEVFNLSDTEDDVKGIAFEQFLGKTFRGELGQFFTPRTVVDYMVALLDPKEGELVCDPCCGSGGFLITAFDYIRNKIDLELKELKEKIKASYYKQEYSNLTLKDQEAVDNAVEAQLSLIDKEFDLQNSESRYYKLSHDYIFGTDANPRMARTAKMNMIMHGDGHGGVHHHDGLLNVNGIFDKRFDVIITNPPFGARIEKSLRVSQADLPSEKQEKKYKKRYGIEYDKNVLQPMREWANFSYNDNAIKGKAILELFDLGKTSSLTEVLFLERCLNLLKPGGRMGIVLPEGIMNNTALQKIRDFVDGQARIINITSIPQDVFIASGATIKPSLLFLQKFTELELENDQKKRKESLNKNDRLKQDSDYELTVAEIDNAGITTTGSYSDSNQLPVTLSEFRAYKQGILNLHEAKFLKIVRSSQLVNWSVSHIYNNFHSKQEKYPSIRISEFLTRNVNTTKILESVEYKRITIKINNKGITLRDTLIGKKIGTKRQFLVSAGQFALSKIDARNGAMGIIPEELDGAVVTADFLTYNINKDVIFPQYLELLTSTKEFIDFCKKSSSGTTNRQRLNEKLFLNATIPLPSLHIQKELSSEIITLKSIISDAEAKLQIARRNFGDSVFKI